MNRIKFGIREKTALLVIFLVAATAYLTPHFIIKPAMKIVETHELVDLADEAELRSWRLFSEIEKFKQTTGKLAADEASWEKFIGEVRAEKKRQDMGERLDAAQWSKYLLVMRGGESVFSRLVQNFAPPKNWERLQQGLMDPENDDVVISPIERIDISSEQAEDDGPFWAPVICAGSRIGDTDEYLIIMYNLHLPGTSRHLIFLADENNEFLVHPDRHHEDFVDERHKKVFSKVAKDSDDRREARRKLGETPVVTSVSRASDDTARKEDPSLRIDPPYAVQEGSVSEKFIAYLTENPEKRLATLDAVNQQIEGFGAIAGEFTAPINLVRVLARSHDDLEDIRTIIENQLATDYPDRNPDDYHIDWDSPVLCGACDININRLHLETIDGSKEYKYIFTGFRDELISNLQREMDKLWSKIIIPSILAGGFAFLAALFFIRPLRAISKSAQHVTLSGDNSSEFQHRIEGVRSSLPVRRNDEVGNIARSLESLLRQVLNGHERLRQLNADLDGKVQEQTQELRAQTEELRGLAAAKDEFLASVSHELRQPLNSIFGFLQFLEMSDLDKEQKGDVVKIRLAASYLHHLINDILDYQKIIMGGMALELGNFGAAEFFENVKNSMEPQADERNNQLVFEGTGGLGVLHNDMERLQQILVNLLSNSCKFTGDGTISLSARRGPGAGGDDRVVIQVTDTGRGMKPEEMEQLFVKFKKLASKEGNKSGTGLGLVISKGLCELMGGSITFESEFGKGTTFTVDIPATIPDPDGELAAPAVVTALAQAPAPTHGKHPLVLVIDDEVTVCRLMTRFLEGHGYEVISANDAESGFALAKERRPAVITLDVVLPGKDGWEILSDLKSDPGTADIPVIMVTFIEEKKRGYTLGADDYLLKPVDWDDLSRRVRRVLGATSAAGPVLVVDDDPDTRDLFRRTLERDGLTVLEAEHGKQALVRLAETRPSLIVLDLMMPVMDGFELVDLLRKNPDWKDIPVVVVTAKSTRPEERERLAGHVRAILGKGGSEQGNLLGDVLALVHRHAATPDSDGENTNTA